jgi:hypothetical protein
MKQYRASAFFIILTVLLFASPHPALAEQQSRALASPGTTPGWKALPRYREDQAVTSKQFREVAMLSGASGSDPRGLLWHYQATAEVSQPGLIETVLPAGVFFGTDNAARMSQLDLTLVGPDNNPRSFELFWRGDTGPRSVALKPSRLLFDKKRMLVWEADAPKDLVIETVRIDVDAPQTMGTVKIEARDKKGWHVLAQNAALYASGGRFAAEISVKPGIFQKLRLSFKGYDKRFRETTLPVTSVTLSGKNAAQDFAQQSVPLKFSDSTEGGVRVLSATLPGLGLRIKTVDIVTDAQFQGTVELGTETVVNGRMQFQRALSGRIDMAEEKGTHLKFPVDGIWPSRSLAMKLNTGGTYIGAVRSLTASVIVPRMVFFADQAGVYLARTGQGNKASIRETPGDKKRKVSSVVAFSDVQENAQWQPESLLEKYAVAGGPFEGKGFRWRSQLVIREAGYYRLVLNRDVSLGPHAGNVRIVREGSQVPYFFGPSEEKTIGLTATPEYDKKKNRTTWTVELPAGSTRLTDLSVESNGIFDRTVQFDVPLQGRAGWQVWRTMRWQNASQADSVLRVSLAGLPRDAEKLRITMEHGDNRPIELRKLQASYLAPALLFLAAGPGEYALYAGFKNALLGLFEDKSWGLYAVLGAVTLILMIVIVKLFPKAEQ